MKKVNLSCLFVLFVFFAGAQIDSVNNSQIIEDVSYLSSDRLEGREVGTKGERLAASYIRKRFQSIGIEPKGASGYFQSFSTSIKNNPHSNVSTKKIKGINVVGYLDNNQKETIIFGAHYDHLGYGSHGSLHAGEKEVHNGADDNASGVAMLLNLAERLKDFPFYNYLFIAFSGEEYGLFGSSYYAKNPTIDLSEVRFMLNFDMIGRLNQNNDLAINGVGTSQKWDDLLKTSNIFNFKLKTSESGIGPSDHTSFYLQDIPSLHFFTGQHEDYHKPTDDVDKINFEGMSVVSDYIMSIIQNSSFIEDFDFQETASESQNTPKFSVTLGVMPDYMYDGIGFRIDGVTKGKTAFKHNIVKGDIVVKMGEIEVIDMTSYMKALGQYESGDSCNVSIKRGDELIVIENLIFD